MPNVITIFNLLRRRLSKGTLRYSMQLVIQIELAELCDEIDPLIC